MLRVFGVIAPAASLVLTAVLFLRVHTVDGLSLAVTLSKGRHIIPLKVEN